jgi:hypothetical protein
MRWLNRSCTYVGYIAQQIKDLHEVAEEMATFRRIQRERDLPR